MEREKEEMMEKQWREAGEDRSVLEDMMSGAAVGGDERRQQQQYSPEVEKYLTQVFRFINDWTAGNTDFYDIMVDWKPKRQPLCMSQAAWNVDFQHTITGWANSRGWGAELLPYSGGTGAAGAEDEARVAFNRMTESEINARLVGTRVFKIYDAAGGAYKRFELEECGRRSNL